MDTYNKKYIGALVQGWPLKAYIGIIIGYDVCINRYKIHWFNWTDANGKSETYWYSSAARGERSLLEKNIIAAI